VCFLFFLSFFFFFFLVCFCPPYLFFLSPSRTEPPHIQPLESPPKRFEINGAFFMAGESLRSSTFFFQPLAKAGGKRRLVPIFPWKSILSVPEGEKRSPVVLIDFPCRRSHRAQSNFPCPPDSLFPCSTSSISEGFRTGLALPWGSSPLPGPPPSDLEPSF